MSEQKGRMWDALTAYATSRGKGREGTAMSEPKLVVPRIPNGSRRYQEGYEEGYRKALQDDEVGFSRLRARAAELEAENKQHRTRIAELVERGLAERLAASVAELERKQCDCGAKS